MNDQAKRNATVTAAIDNNTLSLTFANGETLTRRVDALNSGVHPYIILHGLKQKLMDAATISRNPETGRAATVEDKYQAVKAVFDQLLDEQS